jgi:hypothetical protein
MPGSFEKMKFVTYVKLFNVVCTMHHPTICTRCVQVLRSPNFFSGMEADRNVKVVGGDVALL